MAIHFNSENSLHDLEGQFSHWPSAQNPSEFQLDIPSNSSPYAAQCILDEFVVSRVRGQTALHAGAVVRDGAALLLPGQSHAGKSTLVAQLLRDGWIYYSDEYAFVDDAAWVHPYPRAMFVRNAHGESCPVNVRGPVGSVAAPVRAIVDLRYTSGAEFEVKKLGQSEAVIWLLRNTPRQMEHDSAVPGRMIRLASGTPYFTGIRGEASHTSAALQKLFEDLA